MRTFSDIRIFTLNNLEEEGIVSTYAWKVISNMLTAHETVSYTSPEKVNPEVLSVWEVMLRCCCEKCWRSQKIRNITPWFCRCPLDIDKMLSNVQVVLSRLKKWVSCREWLVNINEMDEKIHTFLWRGNQMNFFYEQNYEKDWWMNDKLKLIFETFRHLQFVLYVFLGT